MHRDLLPTHEIPALSGNSAPIHDEIDVADLQAIGEVPADLNGIYVRNGPNAFYPPDWRYHAYDGDGMLHAIYFDRGKVSYRNRWIKTNGLTSEQSAGRALWRGIKEAPRRDTPDEPLKNTSNTDVKYHAGRLLTMWYRSGVPYELDPYTLATLGPASHGGATARISAHSRPDERTGELIFFDYDTRPPFMRYGVIGPDRQVRHSVEIDLPGPRLPHDMAVTEHYTILHDFPMLLDEAALATGRYKLSFDPQRPARFGIIPRYGAASQIRWFEAKPTYLLHVVNAWERGNEIVMVGTPYRMHEDDQGRIDARRLERTIHLRQRDYLLYEWRFDLITGRTHERVIDDVLNTEFPVINSAFQGVENRFSYNVVFPPGGKEEPRFPGLVKYNIRTGGYIAFSEGPNSFYNEPGFAPRDKAESEDDGYLVLFAWNDAEQRSEVQIFEAHGANLAHGPIARVPLPRRVPHGFHATFVSADVLARWR